MKEWYVNARKQNEIMCSVEAGIVPTEYKR